MTEPGVGSDLDVQISRLAVQLAEDDLRELASLFTASRAAQPQVIWNPQSHQLPSPAMQTLLASWEEAGGRRRAAIGPPPIGVALGPISDMLVRLVADDRDGLVYSHVGSGARALFGDDLLGQPLGDALHSIASPDIVLYAAGYLACRIREIPLLTFNESRRGPLSAVTRLVVPYWRTRGGIGGFFTAISALERSSAG